MNPLDGRPKLLAILHLPPPYHGASTVGLQFVNSKRIAAAFDLRAINLATSFSLDDNAKFKFAKIWRFVAMLSKVLWAMVWFRPQVVYVTANSAGGSFWKDLFVVSLLKLSGGRVCMHFHNKGFAKLDRTGWGRKVLGFFFWKSTAILLSDRLLYDLENTAPRVRVRFCANGIELPPPDVMSNLADRGVKILFLSNLLREKGAIDLLDACSILRDEGVGFRCVFAGQPGDVSAAEFDGLIRDRRLEDRVEYVGPIFGEQKRELYRASSVFAFPTYYRSECFPLVLLEAMGHGLPIVSTAEGAISEILTDGMNGFTCQRRDPRDLALQLRKLLEDDALRIKMGTEARRIVEQKYTVEHFETRMVEILKEELGSKYVR